MQGLLGHTQHLICKDRLGDREVQSRVYSATVSAQEVGSQDGRHNVREFSAVSLLMCAPNSWPARKDASGSLVWIDLGRMTPTGTQSDFSHY